MNEDLRKWFGDGKEGDWVRVGTDGKIKGDCAREPGEGKPKCMPRSKAHSMGKDDRATAARRKRREDPVADRKGKGNKPVMVNTEEFMMEGNEPTNPSLWSKAKSLAKQKFDVYPSAYANGWAAKYYKSKGGGWKSVSEEAIDEKCWDGYKRVGMKKKGKRMVPNCVPEATDIIAKAKAAVAKKAGAKLKMDPDTGTPDHFTAAQRRKKGLDEALTRVTSGNKGYGYHGTVEARDDAEKDKRYSAMHRYAKKLVGDAGHLQDAKKPNVMVKHFLDSPHGRHIADNPTDKNITSRFSDFKKKYKPEMHEEVELEESVDKNHPIVKEYNALKKHDIKTLRGMIAKSGGVVDTSGFKSKDHAASHLIRAKHGNKKVDTAFGFEEEVETLDELSTDTLKRYKTAATADANQAHRQIRTGPGRPNRRLLKRTAGGYAANRAIERQSKKTNEELGKSNEWGTPELRKKYAAMTPGQESLSADKIPSFDPRYDDVTTQHLGLHPFREGYLAEISARGAEARAKFQAKVRQTLADPKNIARAKKTLAKKKEAEKAKEAPHLVMQLRKAVSIGSKVHFQDGQHHAISGNHADIFMSKYNSAKSSIEKEALQKRAHKSHTEFMRTIAEDHSPDCEPMDNMGTHHVDSYEAHRGSGEQISPVISHDDEDIRFQDFDETAFEKELEADVLALSWDDLVDLYDEDEIEYDDSPEEEGEDLEEGITPAGRLKKRFNAMRSKSRRMMARNIAIKRVSSPEKLKSRSIRAARRMVYKRLLRNRDISTVSSSEKTRLEAQIKRMAPMVARLSVRVMPAVRKLEQSRIKNSRTRKRK